MAIIMVGGGRGKGNNNRFCAKAAKALRAFLRRKRKAEKRSGIIKDNFPIH